MAIDRFRNFAKAADACDISQPTLSAMLIKLEEELDVRIFERTNKSVKPTTEGEKIILQAQKALMEAERITEIVNEGKGSIGGSLTLSVWSHHRPLSAAQIHQALSHGIPFGVALHT